MRQDWRLYQRQPGQHDPWAHPHVDL